jgi:hypothetical protein
LSVSDGGTACATQGGSFFERRVGAISDDVKNSREGVANLLQPAIRLLCICCIKVRLAPSRSKIQLILIRLLSSTW